jgi:hypothetical protein
MKMAELDIRDAQINVIRFADSLNRVDVICKLTPGDISLYNSKENKHRVVLSSTYNVKNLIKALEKAIELGWVE